MKKLNRSFSNKFIFFAVLIFLGLSLIGNVCFLSLWVKESDKLKHAIIPTLRNDYFTERIHVTKLIKKQEELDYLHEYQSIIGSEFEQTFKEQQDFLINLSEKVDVNILSQNPLFPNGCEAASATMMLNYYGIGISLGDFVDIYLPKSDVFEKNGMRFGPNPAEYYAGNPRDEMRGWGCFAPVIEKSLESILSDNKSYLKVENHTGISLQNVRYRLPIVIWISTDYSEANEVYEWQDSMKQETYTYPKNSHAVLLVGYDRENYYINDPLKPEKVQMVKKDILEKSYDSLGRQAVGIWNEKTGIIK